MIQESWRDIPKFKGYRISSLGRVLGKRGIMKAPTSKIGYPKVTIYTKGKKVTKNVHRIMSEVFLGIKNNQQTDHIDGNRENNTLQNLRIATHSQNQRNKTTRKTKKSSKYKGVYKNGEGFIAQIRIGDRNKTIGWFKSEDNAGRAYNKVALTTYGDYSRLNIIVS